MVLQSNNQMPLVTNEGKTHLICFNEVLETIEQEQGDPIIMYKYNATRIKYPYTKGELVTSIVRENYSLDNMEAIINNHLSGSETEEQAAAFAEMLAWRNNAKDVAKLIFEK